MAHQPEHDEHQPLDDMPSRAIARRARAVKKHADREAVSGSIDGAYELDPQGPTLEDLERFNAPTVPCSHCGADMFDEASVCPQCGQLVDPLSDKRIPVWAIVIVGVVLAAFLLAVLF